MPRSFRISAIGSIALVFFALLTFSCSAPSSLTETGQPTATGIPVVTANAQWTPQFQDFDGVTMTLVPPGCFNMGSTQAQIDALDQQYRTTTTTTTFSNEAPQTKICFDKPFWIDKTDVTQAQFKQLGGPAALSSYFTGDNRPVDSITWFAARDFCEKQRGAHLPTEAEWEYAARGPDSWDYPWGNTFDSSKVVWGRNKSEGTDAVGGIPAGASWVGALDMSGNIFQWTSTIYDQTKFPYPYNATDGRESRDDTSSERVLRGGSFIHNYWDATVLRSANRVNYAPDGVSVNFGFRCARS
jgi:formylglycine-generating enzyme required for sulfatase activity